MTHAEALQLYEEISVSGITPDTDVSIKSKIKKLYRYCTGMELRRCNCPDVYKDALIIISLRLRDMEKTSKYKLKRGVVIHDVEENMVFTHNNITDEAAARYLAKFPQKANLFEYIPEEAEVEEAEEAEVAEAEEAESPKKKTSKSKPKTE